MSWQITHFVRATLQEAARWQQFLDEMALQESLEIERLSHAQALRTEIAQPPSQDAYLGL